MGHPPGTGLLGMTRAGSPVGASRMAGASKIDPTQMPRPLPTSSMITFETRQNNQANLPPPATSDYVARDTGNCSPRYMSCTMNQIPCTSDLLSTSSMPLALLVQPLAFPHPLEEPIQVIFNLAPS
ncbi:protein transport protein Sec24-like At4g32640 [Nymphaea colorata]|nr:protein transport protein Sec24-like At4g32640 [Nymphaea colorata]